jgi:HK97 family phage major capsid protein
MTTYSAQANASFLQGQVGALLVQPALDASVAAQISTVIRTSAHEFRIPLVTGDPSASWVAEGAEITPSDPTLSELVVVPKKLAGLTIISRELADDASPEAASIIGQGLARDIARKLDVAFFANTTANGPAGLLSLTTSTSVESAASFTTLDAFASAIFTAEGVGAQVDSFITSPAEALALSVLKENPTTGYARPLLYPDVSAAGGRSIYGRPLLVSSAIGTKTAWAIPRDRVFIVIRTDASIVRDDSVFFTSDRVAIRATMRVGFAYPHPLAVGKITHA